MKPIDLLKVKERITSCASIRFSFPALLFRKYYSHNLSQSAMLQAPPLESRATSPNREINFAITLSTKGSYAVKEVKE